MIKIYGIVFQQHHVVKLLSSLFRLFRKSTTKNMKIVVLKTSPNRQYCRWCVDGALVSLFASMTYLSVYFCSYFSFQIILSISICSKTQTMTSCSWQSVWPEKNCQMSIKVAQKRFHYKNNRFWYLYKNCLRMWKIWAN